MIAWLALLMFGLSLAVSLRQPIWSPLDEASHWMVGVYVSHFKYPRIDSRVVFPADLGGATEGQVYQAGEPPLNYVVTGFAGRAAHFFARKTPLHLNPDRFSVYIERLTNSFFLALLIPLLWLCARLLFPGNLLMAWSVPGATFLFRGILIDTTRVSNDVLVTVLTTLGIYLFLRHREGLSLRAALLVGAVAGAATLAKYQGVFTFIAIGAVMLAGLRGPWRRYVAARLRFLAISLVTWAVLVTPWFAFEYQRYGDPTGAAAERKVLPPAALLASDPIPQILASPGHLYLSGLLAEVANPINVHFAVLNVWIARLTPPLMLLGLLVLLVRRSPGGLSRPERFALAISGFGLFLLLVLISVRGGFIVMWDARDQFPAILPATLMAAAPLLLLPERTRRIAAPAAVIVVSCLALFTTFLLSLNW